MAKVKFYNVDFLNLGSIPLKTVISLSNKHQTGEGFEAFIDQVIISYPSEIAHLEIIMTTELYRHYYGETGAQKITDTWLDENQSSLDKLTKNQIPYTLSAWRNFTASPIYQSSLDEINTLYEKDTRFFSIVNQLAHIFSGKMGTNLKNAIHFLLEECSIGLLLTGYIAYPHKELNGAMQYALNRLRKTFTYIPYKVDYRKIQSKIDHPDALPHLHPLYQQLLSLHKHFEQYGIKGRDYQTHYYSDFIRSLEKKNKMPCETALVSDVLSQSFAVL